MYTFPLDLLAPVVTSSVTATSATIVLSQPMDSLPADQYTVTLTTKLGQMMCESVENSVTITSSSNSVLFENLEEYSVYSVTVVANHDLSNMMNSLSASDITTLSAGWHSDCI